MDIIHSVISTGIPSLIKQIHIPSISLPSLSGQEVKTDIELEDALAYRTEQRARIIEEIKGFSKYEKYLTVTQVPNGKIKEYEGFLTTELAWWDDKHNYNKDKKTYRIRITQFTDAVEMKKKALQVISTENLSKMDSKESQEIMSNPEFKDFQGTVTSETFQDEPRFDENATPYTITLQVLSDIVPWVKFLFFFFVAFRLASISANEILYKHISYRLLVFIYIFYFVMYSSAYSIPIIIYYLYKEYSRFFFSGTMDYPIFYSAFPVQRVVTMDVPPIYNKWYQYPHTADEWIQKKREEEKDSMLVAVLGTNKILQSLLLQGGNISKIKGSLGAIYNKFKQVQPPQQGT